MDHFDPSPSRYGPGLLCCAPAVCSTRTFRAGVEFPTAKARDLIVGLVWSLANISWGSQGHHPGDGTGPCLHVVTLGPSLAQICVCLCGDISVAEHRGPCGSPQGECVLWLRAEPGPTSPCRAGQGLAQPWGWLRRCSPHSGGAVGPSRAALLFCTPTAGSQWEKSIHRVRPHEGG